MAVRWLNEPAIGLECVSETRPVGHRQRRQRRAHPVREADQRAACRRHRRATPVCQTAGLHVAKSSCTTVITTTPGFRSVVTSATHASPMPAPAAGRAAPTPPPVEKPPPGRRPMTPPPAPPAPEPEPVCEDRSRFSMASRSRTNSDRLTPASRDILDDVVNRLRESPSDTVKIYAHTDSNGSEEYNFGLSVRRAQVCRGLSRGNAGINEIRLLSEGFGELRPIADNQNRFRSRRQPARRTGLDQRRLSISSANPAWQSRPPEFASRGQRNPAVDLELATRVNAQLVIEPKTHLFGLRVTRAPGAGCRLFPRAQRLG